MEIISKAFYVQGRLSSPKDICYFVIVEDLNTGVKAFGKYCDSDFLLPISEDLRNSSTKNLYWKVTYAPEDKRFRNRRFIAVIPSIKLREGIYDFGNSYFTIRDDMLLQRDDFKQISRLHLIACLCLFSILYGLVAYFHLKRVLLRRYKSVQRVEIRVRKRGRE